MLRGNGTRRGWRASLLVAGVLAQLGLIAPAQIWGQSGPSSGPPPVVSTTDPKVEARGKLLRARAQLGQGNLEAAEAAAMEVARLGMTFKYNEDSPAKLLADLDKARKDPRALLQASRAALTRKDYDAAEKYAKMADRSSTMFSFSGFSDTPSKALKDVAAARKVGTGPSPATAAAPKAGGPKSVSPAPTAADDQARQLVKKARTALAAGQRDEAHKLATEAAALKPNLGWWDDTPDKVLADLKRTEGGAKPAVASAPAPKAPAGPLPTPSAPSASAFDNMARDLLKQARAAHAAGKHAEAQKLANEAAALNANLSPTEDTPEKLLADLKKPSTGPAPTVVTASNGIPRTKPDALKLLADGRKALADGKLDDAASIAQRCKGATALSWGLFEDNPNSLSRDVDKARTYRDRDEAAKLLVEGRKMLAKGDHEGASRLAYRSQTLFNGYSAWDLGDRPNKLLADCQAAKASQPDLPKLPATPTAVVRQETPPPADPLPGLKPPPGVTPLPTPNVTAMTTPPASVPTAPTPTPAPANKLRAQQLVAEAQRFQREGKLVEAKAKADEAMRLNVTFSAEETSPALVYQQVATEARQRVERMSREAHEMRTRGMGDRTTRDRMAESKLAEARTLASAFGQDTGSIDAQLVSMRPAPEAPPTMPLPPIGAVPGTVQTVSHSAPQGSHGQRLLDNARAELKKGEVATARRMAEEALTGNHGVKDQAMDLLRTIDVEEFNQKRLTANRSFDAVESAYRRREYAQAQAMMAMIDMKLLDGARQARLREINLTPEMNPSAAPKPTPGTAVATDRKPGLDGLGTGLMQTSGPGLPSKLGTPGTGRASVSDAPAPTLQDEYKQRQTALFQMMRQKGLEAQSQAGEKFRTGQHAAALEILQEYLGELSETRLEDSQAALLRRPIDSRLNQYRLIKAQKEMVAGVNEKSATGHAQVEAKRNAVAMKQKNVEDLMRQYNAKYSAKDFAGAMALASRAHDLDPDNPVVTAALTIAKRQSNLNEYNQAKTSREEMFRKAANDAEEQPGHEAIKDGVAFDQKRWEEVKKRQPFGPQRIGKTGTKEQAIENKLLTPVNLNFENTPLKQVLDDLRDFHGINIVLDKLSLQSQGTDESSPISIKLDQVSLKSALNLILHQVKLTYVIKDEVLQITTEENAKGKLVTVTYQVADLVVPMEQHAPGQVADGKPNNNQPLIQYTPTPTTTGPSMYGGTPTGSPTGTTMSSGGTSVTKKGASNTQEEQLIKLITSTITPRSWSDVGGAGTIEFYPITFGLVINQTPDIQEQIQELLTALRRLQDQSVAIEVRLITVSEDFFERIGVNFAMNILTDKANRRFEPQLLNGTFVSDPNRFINAFDPKRFIAGLTPAGTLTPTLDIPIAQQSFYQTFPTFGNYTGGGLNVGLAFLSDIQVFLMLEALQGDTRSNVMQAPRITCANGQSATITINDVVQNVVTGVSVVGLPGGQFAFQPQVTPAPLTGGVSLSVQPLITDDRRFVRISIPLTITSTTPGPIPVFPLVVPLFSSLDGVQTGQPVVFTQYIQQPRITTLSVSTEVRIPDGGTVVLGGLKRMNEARTEFGPPVLSKIPYVNRLFKNVGYGKETESLLIMVTARIIVLAEEQERATNFTPSSLGRAY